MKEVTDPNIIAEFNALKTKRQSMSPEDRNASSMGDTLANVLAGIATTGQQIHNFPYVAASAIHPKLGEYAPQPTHIDFAEELSKLMRGEKDPSYYETKLSPDEEKKFQSWKKQYAPKDSGYDYDLRGAFKSGLTPDAKTGHWKDTFKKPNHPTFSDQSQYAKDVPSKAGSWDNENYIPAPEQNNRNELAQLIGELAPLIIQPGGAAMRLPGAISKLISKLPKSVRGMTERGVRGIPGGAAIGALTTDNPEELVHNTTQGGAIGGILGSGIEGIKLGFNAFRPSNVLRGKLSPKELKQNIDVTRGTSTGLGDVIQSPYLKRQYENTLAHLPFTGASEKLIEAGNQTTEKGKNIVSRLLGKTSPEDVTDKLTESLIKNYSKHEKVKSSLYKEANRLADTNELKINTREFNSNLNNHKEAIDNSKLFDFDPDMKNLLSKVGRTVENGKLNSQSVFSKNNIKLADANLLKSKLSQASKLYKTSPDPYERGMAKVSSRLASSLKKDIVDSIESSGNKEVKTAYTRAEENYGKNFSPFLDKDVYKFINGKGDSDTIISSFLKNSRVSDKANQLNKLTNNLPTKDKKLIAAGYFSRAIEKDGNFNPTKLKTLINNLGKNQFKALIPDAKSRQELLDYSKLQSMNTRGIHMMFNPMTGQQGLDAMTGKILGAAGLVGGGLTGYQEGWSGALPGALAGMAATTGLGRAAVKKLTSEKTRNKLVDRMINPKEIDPKKENFVRKLSTAFLSKSNNQEDMQ